MENHFTNRPCAAAGLKSYRYKGRFGFIMIGALNNHDALSEANRSMTGTTAVIANLEIWSECAGQYVNANANANAKDLKND